MIERFCRQLLRPWTFAFCVQGAARPSYPTSPVILRMSATSRDGFAVEVETMENGYAVHFLGCTEKFDARQTAIAFAQTLADGRARVLLASHRGKPRGWIVETLMNGRWRPLTEGRYGLFMPRNPQIVMARNTPAPNHGAAIAGGRTFGA